MEISSGICGLLEKTDEAADEEDPTSPLQEPKTVEMTQTSDEVNTRVPQYLARRSSSAVQRSLIVSEKEETLDGGDISLRPRFLQERSATVVHVLPQTSESSHVPRSKASAFLMEVLAKSKSSSTTASKSLPLEPLHSSGLTKVYCSSPLQDMKRDVALRQVPNGTLTDLATKERSDNLDIRRVSASREHMIAIVRALQANKQLLHQQLDTLESVLRHIQANERDDNARRSILKEIVDVDMIPELARVMREFRFHTELQTCVINILLALAEESPVYAYLMSESNLEKLLEKTIAVHTTRDRLVVHASKLLQRIEDSKRTLDVQTYQAEKAANTRRQPATHTQLLMAAITSKPKSSPTLPSKKAAKSQEQYPALKVSRKSKHELHAKTAAARRQRQVLTLDLAPPALSANYRLLFSQELKRPELLSSQVAPQTPTLATLMSRTLTTASCSDRSIVKPTLLLKRLPYRESLSADGVRRKLNVSKNFRRMETKRPLSTSMAASASVALPSPMCNKDEAPPVNVLSMNNVERSNTSVDGASSRRQEVNTKEDGDEEESYEEDFDFDTSDDDLDRGKAMLRRQDSNQLGSDSELIDVLHDRSDHDPPSSSFPFTCFPLNKAEVAVMTQRRNHRRSARRGQDRPSTSASSKNAAQVSKRKASHMANGASTERRESTGERRIGKHASHLVRAHRQVRDQSCSRRGKTRIESFVQPANHNQLVKTTTSAAINDRIGARSMIPARSKHGVEERQKQAMNNQQVHPSMTQLSPPKLFPSTRQSKVETTVRANDSDPDALKQVQTLYAEGLKHHKENHLGLAIECYEQALAVPGSQDFVSVYNNLGSALLSQNKVSEALDVLQQAKHIQPNNVKVMYNTSLALLRLDRLQQARKLLHVILELEPSHERASIALSHLRNSTTSSSN